MERTWEKEAARLREELARLLSTLKHNREKVPLDVLRTKYKKGYDALCANISPFAQQIPKRLRDSQTVRGIKVACV